METILRIGLSNAVGALVLALVVVTVACVWRRPAVLHALWLLVLVKLVTPPLVWLPEPWLVAAAVPAPLVVEAPPALALPDPPVIPETPDDAPAPALDAVVVDPPMAWEATVAAFSEVAATPPEAPPALPATEISPPASVPWWAAAVFGVWLTGCAGWYALAVYRLQRFRRLLRHAVPAPESLRQRTQWLASKLRLRRCPTVWLVPGRVAPMLWAAGGRPRILFPVALLAQINVEQQNALLVHELAHLRRRDHWVRWLEFAAAGLYWWNPVLWFARRELREAEEQCCDAWVTSTLPGAGKTYATALLETLDFLSEAPHAAPLLASGVGRVSDLKRRLTMIMRGTTPRALSWRGLLAVVGLGALMLPLLPAWARAQTTPPAEPGKGIDLEITGLGRGLTILKNAEVSPEEADKAKEELKKLEDQLAQKQAEVAALAAKVAAARERVAQGAGAFQGRFIIEAAPEANYKALEELLKKLKNQQGDRPTPEIIVIDGATGKIIMKKEGGHQQPPPTPAANWAVPLQGGIRIAVPPLGSAPIAVPPPAPADADKRIDELEQRLKSIMDEVEKLRHERKPSAPEAGKEQGLHSYGPPPLAVIPFVARLFTNAAPAQEQAKALEAARTALQEQQAELTFRFNAEKAADATVGQVKAELDAAEAALRKAEVRREKLEALVQAGSVSQAELKESTAEVAQRRATLEQARAVMEKVFADKKVRQAEIEARMKAAEAERQAAEEKIKELEELLRQKEREKEAAPSKP